MLVQPDWQRTGQEETKTPCQTQQNKRTKTSLIVTKIKVWEVQTSIKSDKLEVTWQIWLFIYAKGLHCRRVTPVHLSTEQWVDDVTTSVVFLFFFTSMWMCKVLSVQPARTLCIAAAAEKNPKAWLDGQETVWARMNLTVPPIVATFKRDHRGAELILCKDGLLVRAVRGKTHLTLPARGEDSVEEVIHEEEGVALVFLTSRDFVSVCRALWRAKEMCDVA